MGGDGVERKLEKNFESSVILLGVDAVGRSHEAI